jgi:hypothetical protein
MPDVRDRCGRDGNGRRCACGRSRPSSQIGVHVLGTGVAVDGCAFPVTVDATGSGTEIDFFDSGGALTRTQLHVTEQGTYSANGKSLVGAPITYNISILFDNSGNITKAVISGVIAKAPLPDGGLFISAGHVDLAARGFPTFILTPDVGATVNLDRFCAALAP